MRSPEPTQVLALDLALPRGTACALVRAAELLDQRYYTGYAELAREVAYQIRQQIGPPMPDEPLLLAAVVTEDDCLWVRVEDSPYAWRSSGGEWRAWTDFSSEVRVLFEGVSTDA